jgi:DNA-dependent RNA polymerase
MRGPLKSLQDLRALLPDADMPLDADASGCPEEVLDTRARTLKRLTDQGSYSPAARALLAKIIPPLAAHLKATPPPRGLELITRALTHEQLALLVTRALLNQIYDQWGLGPDRGKKKEPKRPKYRRKGHKPPSKRMPFCLRVGRLLRDELEFVGLLQVGYLGHGKRRVRKARNKHAVLGRFRNIDWDDIECVRAGGWLVSTEVLDCFVLDKDRLPTIAPDHKAAMDALTEEAVFKHPLYMPALTEPAPWTGWRNEHVDGISSTFLKTNHPETIEAAKQAFADGTIRPHAQGVSAMQSVPLRINPVTLPLLRQFGGEEYARDVAIADAIGDRPFWSRIRCDFRGRLIHLSDFNYTRSDPIRSLFLFDRCKPIGHNINWLEIACANTFGVKGTWDDKHRWVAERQNHEMIKAVAADAGAAFQTGAKEPYGFAAACAEYVAADTYGTEYPTHLPVWLDATANGLQHIAMMLRDERLAKMVNLRARYPDDIWMRNEPPNDVADVYGIVGDAALRSLTADKANPASRYLVEHKEHLRDLCKQPVMTLGYGVTKPGMLDQIKDAAEELQLKLPPGAALRLRDHLWQAIEETIPGAMWVRDWLQRLVMVRLETAREHIGFDKKGKPKYRYLASPTSFVEWTSPTGVPIANRYLKSKTQRVRLPFSGNEVPTVAEGYTNEIDKGDAVNSIVAHLVHSQEAAHLMRSINAATEVDIAAIVPEPWRSWAWQRSPAAAAPRDPDRIIDFMSVHDCYAVPAPDVERFAQIRRWQLALMYRLQPLSPLGLPACAGGKLEPLAAGFSEYLDR